jgi:hypothetical protein
MNGELKNMKLHYKLHKIRAPHRKDRIRSTSQRSPGDEWEFYQKTLMWWWPIESKYVARLPTAEYSFQLRFWNEGTCITFKNILLHCNELRKSKHYCKRTDPIWIHTWFVSRHIPYLYTVGILMTLKSLWGDFRMASHGTISLKEGKKRGHALAPKQRNSHANC